MLTVVLGLGSALGYALHDFLMVKVVRAVAVWTALTWSMGVGVAVLVPLALVINGLPSGSAEWRAVGFATASGICEAAGPGAAAPRPRHRQPVGGHAAGVADRRLRRRDHRSSAASR